MHGMDETPTPTGRVVDLPPLGLTGESEFSPETDEVSEGV